MATLVMGATGNVGPHVVAALHRRSPLVRVLARDPQRAAARLPAGVDIARGDFADEASVRAAADGVEVLFLLTPHALGFGEDHEAALRGDEHTAKRMGRQSMRTCGPPATRVTFPLRTSPSG